MAAENDDRVQFQIDGETYEYPDPLDLDLDEWVIIYDECGLILEDFAPFDEKKREKERIRRLRNPALMKALAMVGVIRTKPDMDVDDARELVGNAKMLGLLESMAPEEAAEADPPTGELQSSESEPSESSERSSDVSNGSSSATSQPSSDEQDSDPAPIGIGG